MSAQKLHQIRFVTTHFNELQGFRYLVPLGLITLSIGGTTYFENGPIRFLRALFLLGGIFLMARAGRYYRRTFGEVKRQPVLPAAAVDSLSIYSPAGSVPRLASRRRIHPAARWLPAAMGLCFVLLLTVRAVSPAFTVSTDESLVQAPWLALDSMATYTGFTEPLPVEWSWLTLKTQIMYLFYGALFLALWLWRGRRLSQSYHLVLGGLLLGLSAAGACMGFFLSGDWGPRMVGIGVWFLPALAHFWVAVVVCGAAMILAGLMDHWQIVRVLGTPAVEEAS